MLNNLFLTPIKIENAREWRPEPKAAHFVLIVKGDGYFLEPGKPQSVSQSQLVVFPQGTKSTLRSSQLDSIDALAFQVRVEYLNGILSLIENYALELNLGERSQHGWVLPCDHAVTLSFKDTLKICGEPGTLPHRLSLLQVVGTFLQNAPYQGTLPKSTTAQKAARRFEELLNQMPTAAIQNSSVKDLASRCGCSPRHFTRLFLEHFGTSLRSKQVELRLSKARQLLSSTDSKIVSIARESGFQHVGLFNSMFKSRYGTTPSHWRRQSQQKLGNRRPKTRHSERVERNNVESQTGAS